MRNEHGGDHYQKEAGAGPDPGGNRLLRPWGGEPLHCRLSAGGAAHGHPPQRHDPGGDQGADPGHGPFRGDRRPFPDSRGEGGQALHRRRGGHHHADPGPAGGGLRRARGQDERPGAGAHRRHPGQAGIHSRADGGPERGGLHRPGAAHWPGGDRPDQGPGPCRRHPVRPAGRDLHRGQPAADCQLHHEQKAGQRRGRHCPGRQDGQRRHHAGPGGQHCPGQGHGGDRRPGGQARHRPGHGRTWTSPWATPWATPWRSRTPSTYCRAAPRGT